MDSGGGFDHLSPDPDLRSLATLSVRVTCSADDNADGIFQRPPSRAFLAQRGSVAHDFGKFWPVELLCGLLLNRSMYTIGCSTVQQYDGSLCLWRLDEERSIILPEGRSAPPQRHRDRECFRKISSYPLYVMADGTFNCALIIDTRHHRTYVLTILHLCRLEPCLFKFLTVGINNTF